MVEAKVIVHDEIVRRKLLAARPRILAQNRLLVESMLNAVKPIVASQTPIGPGHFGYHGRDTLKISVSSKGISTSGRLRAAVQLYWREFGTLGHRRIFTSKIHKITQLTAHESVLMGGDGGERAFMVAHKALNLTRRFISFYYNGMANWWRL